MYIEKISSSIIGIPEWGAKASIPTISNKQQWEFVIQEHHALKAGRHFDIRLGAPNGVGYSWATREIPAVGQRTLAKRQNDHDIKYFDFTGNIPKGYGAGDVYTYMREKAEVVESSPSKITFYVYPGAQIMKFSLVNLGGDDWLFVNHTVSKDLYRLASPAPLKYKTKYVPHEGDISTPKIDGASSVTVLKPGKFPVVYSRRISKRNALPIEYTPKIPDLMTTKPPKGLGTTVLRTEVFATTPDNQEIPNRVLGGILNAGVWKSREMQKRDRTPLRLAAFDIVKYKGRDVSKLPYERKQELIKQVRTKFPFIEIPDEVAQKTTFKEGYVVWPQNNGPIKVKNRPDYDVYVKNIFPAELTKGGTPRAGGIEYSLSPRGPIVGRTGTGWKINELEDMYNNPDKYVGRVAKVFALGQHPSGALRAPAFEQWHWEKSPSKFSRYFAEES